MLKNKLKLKPGGKLDQIVDNFELRNRSFALFNRLFILTICWQIVFIVRIFLLFKAMGIGLNITDAAWMGSLVMLLQVLPISFAGLGIREGAYAYLFTLYGLPAENGVIVGLLFFTQMLVFAGTGAVLNLFEK